MVTNEEKYQELIKKIKGASLLALPQSAAKILELAKDPRNGPPEYAKPISADPGLTSQILKFVNSSFFGFRYKITTVQMALSLVCVRTIKNFVLWNAVFALLPEPKCGPFDLKALVQDALRRGSFAKALGAQFSQLDSEELFVAALLQDMAIPVLAQFWPDEYAAILLEHENTNTRISKLEEKKFGWNHATAGAILVKEWGFGEDLASQIASHAVRSQPAGSEKPSLGESIIQLSSLTPSTLDKEWKDADDFFALFAKIQSKGVPDPAAVFLAADEMFTDLLVVAQLGAPSNTITGFHRQYLSSMLGG